MRNGLKFGNEMIWRKRARAKAKDVLGLFFKEWNRVAEVRNLIFDFIMYIKNIQKSFRGHLANKDSTLAMLDKEWDKEVIKIIELDKKGLTVDISEDLP